MNGLKDIYNEILKMANELEKIAEDPILSEPMTPEKTLAIYKAYVAPAIKAINFFKTKEKERLKGINHPGLYPAYLAAGGEPISKPRDTSEAQVSQLLYPLYEYVKTNLFDNNFYSGQIRRKIIQLKEMVDAAMSAYKAGETK